jgi:flagellin
MRGQVTANKQAERNVQNDINMMKTVNGATSNIIDILNTMRERIVNAANDSNTESNRALIQEELNQLVTQIDDIATNTKYNGMDLLTGGDFAERTFQVGDDINATIQTTFAGWKASDIGVDSLDVSDGDAARSSLTTLDEKIQERINMQTEYATLESRLGFTADNLSTIVENLQASESTIRDKDMAEGMTEFARNNILTQASQFMLAQANQNPYSILNMLQQ